MKKSVRLAVVAAGAVVVNAIVLIAVDRCQLPAVLGTPTPTATNGWLAAAAVGEEYVAYRSTEADCDELVDTGQSESCVWPSSIELVTRLEWEELLPETDFYLIGLAGRHENPEYDDTFRRRLVAWHEGVCYTADRFGSLLIDNGVDGIADEQQELVARAFALMTLPDYLEAAIVFTDWMEVEWHGRLGPLDHGLAAWTELQGLELPWGFRFREGWLQEADGFGASESQMGDYIDVPSEQLPWPTALDCQFGAPGD